MASQVSHMLFADATTTSLDPELQRAVAQSRPYLVLGSQGPDLFYHNQRRRPTGLAYGSLMHRHGYGSTVAGMYDWALERGYASDHWTFAWTLGFASHAILDRWSHPYINSLSGWVDQHDPDTEKYRSMHPFLERLIDVALLEEQQQRHPNEIDFYSQVTLGDEPPEEWLDLMAHALCYAYRKARHDSRLRERLVSAYLDTNGYYQFTNAPDKPYMEGGLAREEAGQIRSIWLSIVHPPDLPEDVDILNLQHSQWPHPCDAEDIRTDSFMDLYQNALAESRNVARTLAGAWGEDGQHEAIAEAVADWNLSDGHRTERPCKRRFSAPLPLREVQDRMKESIRGGNGGRIGTGVSGQRAD